MLKTSYNKYIKDRFFIFMNIFDKFLYLFKYKNGEERE